eukprot:m.26953 g.26953  ORF g.26953 m.26953 type:complete len:498 (-) comp7848_c0_seq2:44-1537(-)
MAGYHRVSVATFRVCFRQRYMSSIIHTSRTMRQAHHSQRFMTSFVTMKRPCEMMHNRLNVYKEGQQRNTSDGRYPALSATIEQLQNKGESLGFAWVTPRALTKGLEGGILARLLHVPGLNLIGARMYHPCSDFIQEYIDVHKENNKPKPLPFFMNWLDSLKPEYDEDRGYPNHMLLLLFTGVDARNKILDAIGRDLPNPKHPNVGATIRGAYGYFRRDPSTNFVTEYEPALVTAHSDESNNGYLEIFAKYGMSDGGVQIKNNQWQSTGLVMLKPNILEKPSSRPGHIMDLFSCTGLTLVGARLFSMSVEEAKNFYGHLTPIFAKKLAPKVNAILKKNLSNAFDFEMTDLEYEVMTALLKQKHAESEVNKIIHFMTGIYPHEAMTPTEMQKRGTARCLALLYHGPNAIETIRQKLGATDPTQAMVGTIRSDYGSDVMRNGCHASDSLESLQKERQIVGFLYDRDTPDEERKPSSVETIIRRWLVIEKSKAKNPTIQAP